MTDIDKKNKSSIWVWFALLLTISLVVWTALQEENTSVDVVVQAQSHTTNNNAEALPARKLELQEKNAQTSINTKSSLIDWEKLNRTQIFQKRSTEKSAHLFAEHSWVVEPPAPKVVKTAPPAPVAPPVPFSYMGRLDGSPKGDLIYLATADKSYSVLIGSKVDAFWMLEKEDAQNLYFTYLPLNLPQILNKNQRSTSADLSLAAKPNIENAFLQ